MDETPLSRGERVLAIFGVVLGFALSTIAIDILSGGRLSRTFVRGGVADQAENYLQSVAPRAGH